MAFALNLSKTSQRAGSSGTKAKIERKKSDTSAKAEIKISAPLRADLLRAQSETLEQLPEVVSTHATISLLSETDMRNLKSYTVLNSNASGKDSINDPRAGPTVMNAMCPNEACRQPNCGGHFGIIKLLQPIFNPVLLKDLTPLLFRCLCWGCGQPILPVEELIELSKRYKGIVLLRKIAERSDGRSCISNTEKRKKRRKASSDSDDSDEEIEERRDSCIANPTYLPNESAESGKLVYILAKTKGPNAKRSNLSAKRALEILRQADSVPNIRKYLGFEESSSLSSVIQTAVLVPPPKTRLDLESTNGIIENSISVSLRNIASANLSGGDDPSAHAERIYKAVYDLVFVGQPNPRSRSAGGLGGIADMLSGKDGLFRGTLLAKRGDFGARTTSSGAMTTYGKVLTPRIFAPIQTVMVYANHWNLKFLRKLGSQGKIAFATKGSGFDKGKTYAIRRDTKIRIEVGDKVERHLMNGDLIIFNRNPSLSRYSIMAGEVELWDNLTVGTHESYDEPLNLDHDGDEPNLLWARSLLARAEAYILLHVHSNIMSVHTGDPTMGLVYDSLTGALLQTGADTIIEEDTFFRILDVYVANGRGKYKVLLSKLETFNIHPFSGRALFSTLLPTNFSYTKGKVHIVDGVFVAGEAKSEHAGKSSRSIVQDIHKNYGRARTAQFITEATNMLVNYITYRGFTVSAGDAQPDTRTRDLIRATIARVESEVESLGTSDHPVIKASLEQQAQAAMSKAADVGKKIAIEYMKPDNNIRRMVKGETGSGAKGSEFSVCQFTGIIGPQQFKGKRLQPLEFYKGQCRFSPHIDYADTSITARDFVTSSFSSGLTQPELMQHTFASREGILDTAVTIQDTGHIHREMETSQKDITVKGDGSVRNSADRLFSFIFGGDGFDASKLVKVKSDNGESEPFFIDVLQVAAHINAERGWIPAKALDYQQISIDGKRKALELFGYEVDYESSTVTYQGVASVLDVKKQAAIDTIETVQVIISNEKDIGVEFNDAELKDILRDANSELEEAYETELIDKAYGQHLAAARSKALSKVTEVKEYRDAPIENLTIEPSDLTDFEIAQVIAARAEELEQNPKTKPRVPYEDVPNYDSLKIAEREYYAGVVFVRVLRTLPNGRFIEIAAYNPAKLPAGAKVAELITKEISKQNLKDLDTVEEDDELPSKKTSRKKLAQIVEEEDTPPSKKTSRKSSRKKIVESDEDTPPSKKTSRKKSSRKKIVESDEDTPPSKKTSRKKIVESDEDTPPSKKTSRKKSSRSSSKRSSSDSD